MVDLGFLLITFFIFTTSMSEPRGMKIKVPDNRTPADSSRTSEEKTLNLVLGKSNELWYYMGSSLHEIKKTDYAAGVRSIINEKKKVIKQAYGTPNELVVLIKPAAVSSFKNIVDILDEMVINGVTRYVLMEPGLNEEARIGSAASGN
jgi:biopolymer transport protein ExbD